MPPQGAASWAGAPPRGIDAGDAPMARLGFLGEEKVERAPRAEGRRRPDAVATRAFVRAP